LKFSEVRSVNEYTVIIAVMPDGAHEPRLVLKHVTSTSAPLAIAEATAAVAWQHDETAPRVGDAMVFDGRLEIASQRQRIRRDRRNPSMTARATVPGARNSERSANRPPALGAEVTPRAASPQR
jgi:hypothetical protein